ncbi:hypothetical protein KCP76_05295 [Salmonella enterica subsp. enterica serovar Weltevreden]|nr:hypothetical protein KCP76_05295 [Salmonella enterica subsp. enterica serovar Weltevreden]
MGIDQLFPVLPLEGLDQVPERRAVLLDTNAIDSDGAIDHYIDGDGIATTILDAGIRSESPMLGCMVGAYQEILSNMHNLFGDALKRLTCLSSDGVEVELSDRKAIPLRLMLQYIATGSKNAVNAFPATR